MRSSLLPIACAAASICLAACSDVMDSRAKEEARTFRQLSPQETELVQRYRDNSLSNGDYLDTLPSSEHLSHLMDTPAYGAGTYSGTHIDPTPNNSLFFPGMVY